MRQNIVGCPFDILFVKKCDKKQKTDEKCDKRAKPLSEWQLGQPVKPKPVHRKAS